MSKQVYVWDKFVRVFHWALLGLFVTSYVTGEQEHWLHTYSGYGIFILVSLRIVWGVVGSQYARFSNFVYSPSAVLGYLKSMIEGSPKRFLGHNPAGGAMVVTLLAALFMTTLSGMKLYAIEEGEGPFAQTIDVSLMSVAHASSDEHEDQTHEYENQKYTEEDEPHEEEEEFWEEIHEAAISVMLFLILLHVLGVIISSAQHKELLVKSMFTGYKKDKQ